MENLREQEIKKEISQLEEQIKYLQSEYDDQDDDNLLFIIIEDKKNLLNHLKSRLENNYIYLPDSYNYKMICLKFKDMKEFIDLQIEYRKGIEKILSNFINFFELEKYILGQNVNIPKVDDTEYNFYHKYSTLGSSYLFLRNNIHIENLLPKELNKLKSSSNTDQNFYFQTLARVMFEKEDEVFFGPAIDENSIKSKSLVFEFAYDQSKCLSLEQLNKIHEIIENTFEILKRKVKESLNLDSSFIIYKAVPNYYNEKNSSNYKLN